MSRYEIAFSGQLVPGAAPDQVKANLARLFQADERRIALLFSGRRMVIKTGLDQAAAEKYRLTLERAGAIAEVRDLDAELVEEIELAPPPGTAPQAAPAAAPATAPTPAQTASLASGSSAAVGELDVQPRDAYMAAFSSVKAPAFGIAPVGADLQDAKPEPEAPKLDLSGLSVAPVGSDMGEKPRDTSGPVPDISHLRLEP